MRLKSLFDSPAKCIVFDFDGTLVNSNSIKRDTFFEIAAQVSDSENIMEEVLHRSAGKDRYWIFQEYCRLVPQAKSASFLASYYSSNCENKIVDAPEVSGAQELLLALREAKISLFLSSATPLRALTTIVELRGQSPFFKGLFGSPDTKIQSLHRITNLLNLSKHNICVVGDGELDRASAADYGCSFIAVKNPFNNFLEKPEFVVSDMHELLALLEDSNVIHKLFSKRGEQCSDM